MLAVTLYEEAAGVVSAAVVIALLIALFRGISIHVFLHRDKEE